MGSKSIYSDSYQKIIRILREVREKQGITQSQLAEILGEEQSYVSKIELRERRIDIEELRRFCEALGVPLSEVVHGWENSNGGGNDGEFCVEERPAEDSDWSESDWRDLLSWFVSTGLLTYKEITALTLGHLNPSQVGTSIASKKTFQVNFPPRKCWEAVRKWHFEQTGRCIDCGTRLELQADHITPREVEGDSADRLENMTLRCRRCNVIKRPSHKQGGLTFLTAEAALMWILFTKRPRTYQEFETLCRSYGMTMANIRFQESWAMARWLNKEGLYEIDGNSKY